MKNVIWPLLISLTLSSCYSLKNVPEKVKGTFSKNHPRIKKGRWKQLDANYLVRFKEDKTIKEEVYNSKGERELKREVILKEDLPSTVTQVLQRDFSENTVENVVYEEETVENGRKYYGVTVNKEGVQKVLYFDDEGHVVD